MFDDKAYLLGAYHEELYKVKIQHSVWRSEAMRRWIQSDHKKKNTILYFECVYGYYSIEIADFVNLSKQDFSTIYAPLMLEIVF